MDVAGKSVFVTGCAGFIGGHLCRALLESGASVTAIDNLSGNREAKKMRVGNLISLGLIFAEIDIRKKIQIDGSFDTAIHLAAKTGVRDSVADPTAFVETNCVGFSNTIEFCADRGVGHFLYASSSSVYGLNDYLPYKTSTPTDSPASVYAATKKSNELLAHAYARTLGMKCTGMRFFTVYGPDGRDDMAPSIFCRAILSGKKITVNNNGDMSRDFTHISDVISAIDALMRRPGGGHKVYNVASGRPVGLMEFIRHIENATMKKAIIEFSGMQPGDVRDTWGDIQETTDETGWCPTVKIEDGIDSYVRCLNGC